MKILKWFLGLFNLAPVNAAALQAAMDDAVQLGTYIDASGALNNHASRNPKAVRRIDRLSASIAANIAAARS